MGRPICDWLSHKPKKGLAPRDGFEPSAVRLTVGCSTAELPGNIVETRGRNSAISYECKSLDHKLFHRDPLVERMLGIKHKRQGFGPVDDDSH
jgi:hypothetical protein